jgi:Ala-tRNA(Pro) deacylase
VVTVSEPSAEAHDSARDGVRDEAPSQADKADAEADKTGEAEDAYTRLISMLDEAGAKYRVIEHAAEGRTDVVSAYRGHPVEQAAKCLVVLVKIGKRTSRYFLAVVPGDRRVDLGALKARVEGTYAAFASTDKAEALAGSVSGTILPFSFHPDLELVVDPGLTQHPEIYFNAARLDRSLALATEDYLRLANARISPIAAATT